MNVSKYSRRIMVTGGAGFIGSNLLLELVPKYRDYFFLNVDSLSYAANLSNLDPIKGSENYRFERCDIRNFNRISSLFADYRIDAVIHLAAESHVDRSIIGPTPFIDTNVVGTFNLLECARKRLADGATDLRFHHISTDEVFGDAEGGDTFSPSTPYAPSSPYAATKASADHLVRAYHRTYGIDIVITNCSNNFGPYQFPEKLVPLVICNALNDERIPVYGDGEQTRDWLYVVDHCHAIDIAFHQGRPGETYLIGQRSEIQNIDLVRRLLELIGSRIEGKLRDDLVTHVSDRPGHDRRYAIDPSKIEQELGWKPQFSFQEALSQTVDWYLAHRDWLEKCKSGEYMRYYEQNYGDR